MPWIPRSLSLELQRACLRACSRIGVHYISAIKAVPYDRMHSGNQMVTMACLHIAMDALIRLQAAPAPSPFSAMLHKPEMPSASGGASTAADAAVAALAAAEAGWACPVCTVINPASATSCGTCGTSAGGWKCPSCTYSNGASANKCGMCNQPKPGGGGGAGGGGGGSAPGAGAGAAAAVHGAANAADQRKCDGRACVSLGRCRLTRSPPCPHLPPLLQPSHQPTAPRCLPAHLHS